MLKYGKVMLEAKKALNDNEYLAEMKSKQAELTKEINRHMMNLKRQGHVMGADFRNKLHTTVQVPNKDYLLNKKLRQYSGVIDLKTLRLDHKITASYIFSHRKKNEKVLNDKNHLDNEFVQLAHLWKDSINISRILKQVELSQGSIIRSSILAINHDDNRIEYF